MIRDAIKWLVSLTPYRVTKNRTNRFDSMEEFLHHLPKMGYQPRVIVDGGAHLGWFSLHARRAFPQAEIHMVEPQPACAAALKALAARPGFNLHTVALTAERKTVKMTCNDGPDTGAYVAAGDDRRANTEVQGETLDNLFLSRIADGDRAFLKLDLQGHEISALKGGSSLLPRLELVLTEFSFFTQLNESTVPEIVRFFDNAGFELFDIVSISQRNRDGRAKHGDLVFVRKGSPLWSDRGWE
jgi:FkbM family methyltransferase